ncbi:hypothetical protein IWW43_002473, partial [Coemansia sp. RSA 1935]
AKETSITWHFRNADPEYGEFQAKECMNHLENSVVSKRPVEILVGKKCLEVRPISVNKGEIVKRLMGAKPKQWDFVVCAGDDKTDEDMFRSLRTIKRSVAGNTSGEEGLNAVSTSVGMGTNWSSMSMRLPPYYFTITVGPPDKRSAAAWHVSSSHDVVEALMLLAASNNAE